MPEAKWIKIKTNIFDDEKIIYLSNLRDSSTLILVWFKLLCLAGQQGNGGVFKIGDRPYTPKLLASQFRMKESQVKSALSSFEELSMITINDGVITIKNWDKHQSLDTYDKKKERNKRYYEKHKNSDADSDDNSDTFKTHSDTVEEEREEEEEIYSFIHSLTREKGQKEKTTEIQSDVQSDDAKRKLLNGKLGDGLVMLSDEQMDSLCQELTLDELNYYIGVVRDCEKAGKKFKRKTHYEAILEMAKKDRAVANGR